MISIYHLSESIDARRVIAGPAMTVGRRAGQTVCSLPYTTVRRPPIMLISSTTSANTNKI